MYDEECPQDYTGSTRKLTAEELQKSVERLNRSTREPVKLKPVIEPTYISQEDLDKRIKHLYDDSLERRRQEREDIERQMQAAIMKDAKQTSCGPMTQEELDRMVHHLYDESLARKKQSLEELEKQEAAKNKGSLSTKTWTPSEEKEIADRLYRGGMERERKKRIEAFEKFVLSRRPAAPHRTTAELAMSADKMTKGEGLLS